MQMQKRTVRRDKLIEEYRHDTYKEWGKWPEPTLCSRCGALFSGGRWTWGEAPENANKAVCPACKRIEDKYPAGEIQLSGDFFKEHKEEILNLITNEEKAEKAEHPMERIMAIEQTDIGALVKTTGVHIAKRIGHAVSKAYKGDLDIQYGDGENSIRIAWTR